MGYFAAVCCFTLMAVASGNNFNRGSYDRKNGIRQQDYNRRSDFFTRLGYIRHAYKPPGGSKYNGINAPFKKDYTNDEVNLMDLNNKYNVDKKWKKEYRSIPVKHDENFLRQIPDNRRTAADKEGKTVDTRVAVENDEHKSLDYKVPATTKDAKEDTSVPVENDYYYFKQLGYKIPSAAKVEEEEDTSVPEKDYDNYLEQLGYKVPVAAKVEKNYYTSFPEDNENYFEQVGYKVPAAAIIEEKEDESVPEKKDNYLEQLGNKVPAAAIEEEQDTYVPEKNYDNYLEQLGHKVPSAAKVEKEEDAPLPEDEHYFQHVGYKVPETVKDDTYVAVERHKDYFTHLLEENEETPASVEDEEISWIEDEDSPNVISENEPTSDAAHEDKDENEVKRNEAFLYTLAKTGSKPLNERTGAEIYEKKQYNDLHELQLNRKFYNHLSTRRAAQDQRRLYFKALRQREQAEGANTEESTNNAYNTGISASR